MSTKPEIKKYKRGNDEVNLNDWLNKVSENWDAFEQSLIGRTYTDNLGNKKTITEKDIPELRKSYDKLFKRFNTNSDSLIYNYDTADKGFTDNTGILSSTINIYDGIVSKHFGDTLREMDIYIEPEKEEKTLGDILVNRLLGSSGTIQDFIDLDLWDATNKTRSNVNRSENFKNLLTETIRDLQSGSKEFLDWDEEKRNSASSDLNDLFTIFNDGLITNDEYLQLSKKTGISNLRDFFAIDNATNPDIEKPLEENKRNYSNFIRWVQKNYSPYEGDLLTPISLSIPDNKVYGQNTVNSLVTTLQKSSTSDLHSLIRKLISNPDYDINYDEFITKIFPQVNPQFSNNYVLGQILNTLKNRTDGLYNFGETNLGVYFIPTTKTDRNTGFVWDSNNNTINEMSIHNIPYWRTKIRAEWDAESDEYENDLNSTLTLLYNRNEFK